MRISKENVEIANEFRIAIQSRTETISDGEGIAMIILWTFLQDHAHCEGIDLEELVKEQIDAFTAYARENMKMVQVN